MAVEHIILIVSLITLAISSISGVVNLGIIINRKKIAKLAEINRKRAERLDELLDLKDKLKEDADNALSESVKFDLWNRRRDVEQEIKALESEKK